MVAELSRIYGLPSDIDRLLVASAAEGYDFIERLVGDWHDGSNRFDRPGEVLLEARVDGELVAIGGLNRDPYIDDPGVGRIRHLYVHPSARGDGVGRSLVSGLVDHSRAGFARVRLRAGPADANAFYEALGFEVLKDEEHATHGRMLL